MQPNDEAIFYPTRGYYNTAADAWLKENKEITITIYCFRVTGIYPLDRDIFTDTDYLPFEVTDCPMNFAISPTTEDFTISFTGVTSLIQRAVNQPDSYIFTPKDI